MWTFLRIWHRIGHTNRLLSLPAGFLLNITKRIKLLGLLFWPVLCGIVALSQNVQMYKNRLSTVHIHMHVKRVKCNKCARARFYTFCKSVQINIMHVQYIDWGSVSYCSKFSKKSGWQFYMLCYKICVCIMSAIRFVLCVQCTGVQCVQTDLYSVCIGVQYTIGFVQCVQCTVVQCAQ